MLSASFDYIPPDASSPRRPFALVYTGPEANKRPKDDVNVENRFSLSV